MTQDVHFTWCLSTKFKYIRFASHLDMLVGHVLSHLSPPQQSRSESVPGDLVPTKESQTQVESRKRRLTASLPLGKCVFCWGFDIFFLGIPLFSGAFAGDWFFREGNSCDGNKLSSSVIYVSRLISEFFWWSRTTCHQTRLMNCSYVTVPTFVASQSIIKH